LGGAWLPQLMAHVVEQLVIVIELQFLRNGAQQMSAALLEVGERLLIVDEIGEEGHLHPQLTGYFHIPVSAYQSSQSDFAFLQKPQSLPLKLVHSLFFCDVFSQFGGFVLLLLSRVNI
jgi:hypothetical protein